MDTSTEIGTEDLAVEVGVSRQMIGRWAREGLEEVAKIRRGKWDRERALTWIGDRREDSVRMDDTNASPGDLVAARIRLYNLQADGAKIRNDLAEASVVYRDTAERVISESAGQQIAAGDAWARDPGTEACKPLLDKMSPAQLLQIKAELWNELRRTQADAIRSASRTLAIGEDVGSARVRVARRVG